MTARDWEARRDRERPVSDHGGNLAAAQAAFPRAPTPWLDLSTGINPHSYPVPALAETAFTRLPDPGESLRLAEIAARAYGAPWAENVVAAPGTQILLPLVASLVPPGRAVVLSPTYAEHARTAAIAGHLVEETGNFEGLAEADLAIVVNPNNPDGRLLPPERLAELARQLGRRGGLLVIDEAFMDVGPAEGSLASVVEEPGLVVLRSFGKFFGLAGVRLGFAIAGRDLARRLAARLGPWAVSGPAQVIGIAALGDADWRHAMRDRLASEMAELDRALEGAGLAVAGGTDLFRLARHPAAATLHGHLGRRGILVRRFEWRADLLRIGLPGSQQALSRLAHALSEFRTEVAT